MAHCYQVVKQHLHLILTSCHIRVILRFEREWALGVSVKMKCTHSNGEGWEIWILPHVFATISSSNKVYLIVTTFAALVFIQRPEVKWLTNVEVQRRIQKGQVGYNVLSSIHHASCRSLSSDVTASVFTVEIKTTVSVLLRYSYSWKSAANDRLDLQNRYWSQG